MKTIETDPVFLMNIIGALTARTEDDFKGYDGTHPEDPSQFISALIKLMIDDEVKKEAELEEVDVETEPIAPMFQGKIGQKVCLRSMCILITHD